MEIDDLRYDDIVDVYMNQEWKLRWGKVIGFVKHGEGIPGNVLRFAEGVPPGETRVIIQKIPPPYYPEYYSYLFKRDNIRKTR